MIEVINLVKRFGAFTAVDDISFAVKQGEVLGFLGPNGAGKSTTMKIITCFLPPSSGTVRVGDMDIHNDPIGVRELIGYLPESAPSYSEMTVEEFLVFMAQVRGLEGEALHKSIDKVVELTALEDVRKQIIDTLSKGYRQRCCFAQALVHDPPVLILDEPTDGLDPNQKHEMRDVIRQMAQEKTIVLSTHILEEMEAVCSRAIIIAHGKIVVDGSPEELAAMSRYHNAVRVVTREANPTGLNEQLSQLPGVKEVAHEALAGGRGQFEIFPQDKQIILPAVTRLLESANTPVEQIIAERGRVDDVFRQVTQPGNS